MGRGSKENKREGGGRGVTISCAGMADKRQMQRRCRDVQ